MPERAKLIADLASALEGSRGLDYRIHEALGWQDNDECGWSKPATGERTADTGWPHYTTSLDAALTLIPHEFPVWNLSQRAGICLVTIYRPSEEFTGNAATPALALCIAALKTQEKDLGGELGSPPAEVL